MNGSVRSPRGSALEQRGRGWPHVAATEAAAGAQSAVGDPDSPADRPPLAKLQHEAGRRGAAQFVVRRDACGVGKAAGRQSLRGGATAVSRPHRGVVEVGLQLSRPPKTQVRGDVGTSPAHPYDGGFVGDVDPRIEWTPTAPPDRRGTRGAREHETQASATREELRRRAGSPIQARGTVRRLSPRAVRGTDRRLDHRGLRAWPCGPTGRPAVGPRGAGRSEPDARTPGPG